MCCIRAQSESVNVQRWIISSVYRLKEAENDISQDALKEFHNILTRLSDHEYLFVKVHSNVCSQNFWRNKHPESVLIRTTSDRRRAQRETS